MKNKPRRFPFGAFLLHFILVFGLLIAPWPGWNEFYAHYFRELGQLAFSRDEGKRVVVFSPNTATDAPALDTEITLANRDLVDSSGRGPMKRTGIDTRSIGWVPTALTVALIAATPIPLRRRFWAILAGLVLVHAYVLFSIQAWIWNNSPDVSLFTLSSFWKDVADDLDYTLLAQLGASFSVPVLIWILVTFQRHDAGGAT